MSIFFLLNGSRVSQHNRAGEIKIHVVNNQSNFLDSDVAIKVLKFTAGSGALGHVQANFVLKW